MKNALDTAKISAMVRTKRGSSGLRAVSTELGNEVSPSTLSRIENGKVPDMETFLLLCDWVEVPPAEFFVGMCRPLSTAEEIGIMICCDSRPDPATANYPLQASGNGWNVSHTPSRHFLTIFCTVIEGRCTWSLE